MRIHELPATTVTVFGAARSGLGAVRLLKSAGAVVRLVDEKATGENLRLQQELLGEGISSFFGPIPFEVVDDAQFFVKSPGIPPTHPLVCYARERGCRIVSEVELAAAFLPPQNKIVAVTGTNGKTTTTAWISHLLTCSGFYAPACGNIGLAFSEAVRDFLAKQTTGAAAIFVVEVSSFQLEDIEDFRPDVAVLTNLAPDHLDRYPSYREYVAAKENIVKNMCAPDALVWNSDNPDSVHFAPHAAVRRLAFSATRMPPSSGAGLLNGMLTMDTDETGTVPLLGVGELPLVGKHNVENALASALAAFLAGASLQAIREGLRSFQGVEHRIEFCGELRGVRFYNDSKATNLDSLEKALQSFSEPVILIAGGRDKKSDYVSLLPLVRERVKALLTIGEAAPLIENAWSRWVPTQRVATMEDAVRCAMRLAQAGDVVLLSPACASYDMYRNFEERGRHFKDCVRRLIEQSS
ncbi:MAG: UDP-N-acetylmuramoyl-L-alanine--D-glutamate ligase [Candidatus Sumerlaeaceae bacterium]|nr:UDP-N-acetylmuramoyl-L-alanine--D-glutamate ligase [Candidatus Sumerlaeaceae bacterium]